MPDTSKPIADVQSQRDQRRLAINKVGVRDIKHPLKVTMRNGTTQSSSGVFGMFVNLPHDQKGTHMSRFVELLNQGDVLINTGSLTQLLHSMNEKLEADSGYISVAFDLFMEKSAPVSEAKSLMDYQIKLEGSNLGGTIEINMSVLVPVTSLCPCSKKVADYGAHNQRSHITVTTPMNGEFAFEDIIEMVESQSSSELYGILKRTDEKFITEQAYDNPKFVEDLIRDIAQELSTTYQLTHFKVEAENFESIHNHSAYAVIQQP